MSISNPTASRPIPSRATTADPLLSPTDAAWMVRKSNERSQASTVLSRFSSPSQARTVHGTPTECSQERVDYFAEGRFDIRDETMEDTACREDISHPQGYYIRNVVQNQAYPDT